MWALYDMPVVVHDNCCCWLTDTNYLFGRNLNLGKISAYVGHFYVRCVSLTDLTHIYSESCGPSIFLSEAKTFTSRAIALAAVFSAHLGSRRGKCDAAARGRARRPPPPL